ncbi:MAG: lysylphosphatidylglycerol synthase domain-containing protein, partial [Actinomycetota bacterium]
MTSAVTTSGRPSRSKRLFWLIGTAALVVSLIALADEVKFDALRTVWREVTGDPVAVLAVLAIYGAAFGVRAWVWTRILPSLRAGHALAALHISLAGNHLLPLRLGEALRVTSVVRRARIELAAATASTVMLRAADVLAVVSLAALFGSSLVERLVGPFAWLIPAGAVGVWIVGVRWLKRLQAERGLQIRISTMLIASTAV